MTKIEEAERVRRQPKKNELLPCPHCGTIEGLYPSYRIKDWTTRPYMTLEEKPYAIDCVGCGYDFTPRPGMDVIAMWNRRAALSEKETET